MASDFDKLWADALSTFRATTDRQLDDKILPKLRTLDDLKVEISKRQDSFEEFRKNKHALFNGLSKALGPISMLADVAAGGLSNAFPPSGVAFNAFNYMIAAAENVSASYDSVCDLLEDLSNFTTRLTVHARQGITPELRGIVIQILCAIIKLCGYATRLMKRGRVGEYFKKVYLGKDKEISDELATIRRLTETEALLVGALTLSTTVRMEAQVNSAVTVLSEVNSTVRDTNTGIVELRNQVSSLVVKMNELKTEDRTQVEQKQLDKIRLILSPSVTPEEIYRGISAKRLPGTGDWVRDERLFKAWLDYEKPVLWISGGPGAGKSYLSSNIIQLLQQIHPQRVQAASRVSVAYYFCKDYDPDLRSFNKALRSLAFQICQNDPVYAKYVAGVCSFPEDIRTTESLWHKLFVDFFRDEKTQGMVYILIDGMDEALEHERATFLELLKQSSAAGGKIRVQVLMVGRPELSYDIEQILEENLPTISVSAVKNSADIHNYVVTKVSRERNLRRISPALREEIVSGLTQRADGMFLWVDLMLKTIASKHKEVQMREALQEAPKGLSDAIQHTLDRVRHDLSEQDAEDFDVLLAWVTCAQRPFKLGELEDVLKLTSKEGEGVVYLEGELRKRYASFFNLIREDGRTTEELQMEHEMRFGDEDLTSPAGDMGVKVVNHDTGAVDDFGENMDIDSNPTTTDVMLSHASFGDFFRIHQREGNRTSDHGIWSLQITKHLLRMLHDPELRKMYWNRLLSGYAGDHWQEHLKDIDLETVSEDDRVEIGKILVSMIQDEEVLKPWVAYAIIKNGSFRESWIYSDETVNTIKRWIRALPTELQPEEKAMNDPLDFMIEFLAKSWMKDAELNFPENAFMMEALRANGTLPQATDYDAMDLAHNSPETILKVARHYNFEEDYLWNGRVGRVLREAGHYEAAISCFQTAIDVAKPDEKLYRAYTGLGLAYQKQGKHSEAISAVKKGLEASDKDLTLSEADRTLARNYWSTEMLTWAAEVRDTETVAKLSKDIIELYPDQYGAITIYVLILIEQKQYSAAMKIFRDASEKMMEEKGHTRLTDWCIEATWRLSGGGSFYDALVDTCRELSEKDFARQTYLDAIKAVQKTDSHTAFLLQAGYGKLLLREFNKPKQASRIFEKILEDVKLSRKETGSSFAKVVVVDLLCEIYVDRALEGGKGSKAAIINMEKLSQLWAKQVKGADSKPEDEFSGNIFTSTRNSTLALAALYGLYDQHEEAKPLLKDHLKLGFDLLTDDDPENDYMGYIRIAETLSRTSDTVNALAAWAVVAPKWISGATGGPSDDLPEGSAPHDWYSCNGACSNKAKYGAEDMHVCTLCIDTCWCRECYSLLRDGKLSFNACGKIISSSTYRLWNHSRRGRFLWEEGFMDAKEWLAKLRKEWDL